MIASRFSKRLKLLMSLIMKFWCPMIQLLSLCIYTQFCGVAPFKSRWMSSLEHGRSKTSSRKRRPETPNIKCRKIILATAFDEFENYSAILSGSYIKVVRNDEDDEAWWAGKETKSPYSTRWVFTLQNSPYPEHNELAYKRLQALNNWNPIAVSWILLPILGTSEGNLFTNATTLLIASFGATTNGTFLHNNK